MNYNNRFLNLFIKSCLLLAFLSCSNIPNEYNNTLWFDKPANRWAEAFPIGNGRIAAMYFGGITAERFLINEESLWAGTQINPYAGNFHENLKKIQEMVLAGDFAKAHDFGVENLTACPTSFRSYEPFADLFVELEGQDQVRDYRRELDLSAGVGRVSYKTGDATVVREAFISAVDDVLVIRLSSSAKGKLNCQIGLQRFKDTNVTAYAEGKLKMDGQIVDIEAPEWYDDNPGGSGPGGKHMRFAGRLACKTHDGKIQAHGNKLQVEDASEVIIVFTAATNYDLSLFDFDESSDPGEKADKILEVAQNKTWTELKDAHTSEHSSVFDRVSLTLGDSANRATLPVDKRLDAFRKRNGDSELTALLFQFGRYLLMNSSRRPAILPSNLQGKWNEDVWAPWESDYHLNVNLQMNYWPSNVTNLQETNLPLIDWFEKITEISRPLAQSMYNSGGWFSGHATNPFGRVTPSASTIESQFDNGVLDPLAGAWMVMNLWDYFEYSQDTLFLRKRLFPMLSGASEFILDVLVTGSDGTLQFVPSTSPENAYIDPSTGRGLRITSTSTCHLSIIKAVFEATVKASGILDIQSPVCNRITEAEKRLPSFRIGSDGNLLEWREDFIGIEPGHRHLSHLLGVHPFALITSDDPALFGAAKKSLERRQQNGQGNNEGWSCAHSSLMYAWFMDGEKANEGMRAILASLHGTLLNAKDIFQIDANFGATACVAEMLLQSHTTDSEGNYIIHLLPAIPDAWTKGSVKGLCARGGYIIDVNWNGGQIANALITSQKGGECSVRYKNSIITLRMQPGEKRKLMLGDFLQ